jgi:hypothetical protein
VTAAHKTVRTHLVAGGFPPGSPAGHDMDYARLRLLELLERWLPGTALLITYVAGPYPDVRQHAALVAWLQEGGRWLALHGTSGGKAAPVDGQRHVRKMVKLDHHHTLGGFFLNHPPLRKFRVAVHGGTPLTEGVPEVFDVMDELYLIELCDPSCRVLLTTELPRDPSPPGFGFVYDADTALQPDGVTRVLGYTRPFGRGEICYFALGHCHNPGNNVQPFVDASVEPSGATPLHFRGAWETEAFTQLLRNGIAWGVAAAPA